MLVGGVGRHRTSVTCGGCEEVPSEEHDGQDGSSDQDTRQTIQPGLDAAKHSGIRNQGYQDRQSELRPDIAMRMTAILNVPADRHAEDGPGEHRPSRGVGRDQERHRERRAGHTTGNAL